MTVLLVFESMYGSTRDVAEAVADGLREGAHVRVVEVGALAAEPGGSVVPDETTLLVVGGPTHAFGMSTARTRASAAQEASERTGHAGTVSPTAVGIREWIEGVRLPRGRSLLVATFGTKVRRPNLPGSAARAAERALRRRGGVPLVPARTFTVLGMADGLADGELAAAREWGRALATALPADTADR